MSNDQARAVFKWKGRVCVVVGEAMMQRRPARGQHYPPYLAVHLVFIDGSHPREQHLGKRTFGNEAKVLRGNEWKVWQRVRELLDQGILTPTEARRHAMAELSQGIMTEGGPEQMTLVG
jgi:hypothetical protein